MYSHLRSAGSVMYSSVNRAAVKLLPRKARRKKYYEACMCGDKECNNISNELGHVLKKRCSYMRPPARPVNENALAKLSKSQARKVVRSRAIHTQIMTWRRDHGLTDNPTRHARFNELHYPLELLHRLKDLGKKSVPSYISIDLAKEVGMFSEKLVVAGQCACVPTLNAQDAKATRMATITSPEQPADVAPEPVSAVDTSPNSTTARNIIVVGLVRHPSNSKLLDPESASYSPTAYRDQTRILELQKHFDTVISVAKYSPDPHPTLHVTAPLGWSAANAVSRLMKATGHAGKQFNYICFDYVRFPSAYYSDMILGGSRQNGRVLPYFVGGLHREGLIAADCRVQFARHERVDSNWSGGIEYMETYLGKSDYTHPQHFPLFKATQVVGAPPLDHEQHLLDLTADGYYDDTITEFEVGTFVKLPPISSASTSGTFCGLRCLGGPPRSHRPRLLRLFPMCLFRLSRTVVRGDD